MPEVAKSARIAAPASRVWALVSPFDGLPDWLPPVATSETEGAGIGAVRTLTMQDGGVVKERLDAFDANAMSYSYTMIEMGPVPLDSYRSTVTVTPADGEACTMSWVGQFEPKGAPEAEVRAMLDGLYESGLGRVREKLAG